MRISISLSAVLLEQCPQVFLLGVRNLSIRLFLSMLRREGYIEQ
jgi:hypothetical protein